MDRTEAAWRTLAAPHSTFFKREAALTRYRQGVADILKGLSQEGPPHEWPEELRTPGKNGEWRLQVDQGGHHHETWSPEVVDAVRPLSIERRRHLELARLRREGLGTPYLAIHRPRPDDKVQKFIPAKGQYLPMTPVVEFRENRTATLRLVDPREVKEVQVGGRMVPLSADFSLPVRRSLQPANFVKGTVGGLVRPGNHLHNNGLFLMEPYRRDKVPVIFIHGLMADPHIWQAHAATLMADPELGSRVQCWYFVYPTGLPVISSATWFRDSLRELKSRVDPDGNDPAFRNLLLVGHSMGGLIARMQATRSSDTFWKTWFLCAPEQLRIDPHLRDELRKMLFFEANADVTRIVFMNTPHQGSRMAGSWLGRWGSSMVRSPGQLMDLASAVVQRDIAHVNPNRGRFDGFGVDGIKSMRPDHPLIMDLARQPIQARHHTIVGDLFGGKNGPTTDGVVPYESAHLPSADSELIVPAWHGDVTNRSTVAEIRRIVRLHVLGSGH